MAEATAVHPVELTDATFEQEALAFDGVVLVDFWATWCPPCKIMAPVVDALAKQYADNPRVRIAKMDVDAHTATAQSQMVMALPTFKVFAKGTYIDEVVGADPSGRNLEAMIQRGLASLGA